MAASTRLSEKSQKSLVKYVRYALDQYKSRTDLFNKQVVIDMAYARYQQTAQSQAGVDTVAANYPCGTLQDITAPIIVSQVDSIVAYLADIYCSGYPIFPVVSGPKNKTEAATLQSIIDTHAMLGGYPRQLLKFFRNAVKYNVAALEVEWAPIERYSVLDDITKPLDKSQVKKTTEHYSRLTCLDAYNTILDPRVEEMCDVPSKGEFAGKLELMGRISLIRELQYLASTDYGYNTTQALHSAIGSANTPIATTSGLYYRQKPQISKLISSRSMSNLFDFDWTAWMEANPQQVGRTVRGLFEVCTLYARIIPEEHGIYTQNKDIPQIYQLKVVNNDKLICAKRLISAYDLLPIFVGQPFEDGFAEQTQSAAEMQMDYQDGISKLINIRFASARRAVVDRGIYDPKMIESSDVNSANPAAKIPIKPNSKLGGKGLQDAYFPIPYDERGISNVIADAGLLINMSGQQTGVNKPQQGEFQKGNKSVQEWQDTMAGSDNRLRLQPMSLEYQVMMPVKEQLKLNVYQYGPTGIFQDVKGGEPIEVTEAEITALRKKVLYFKVADGYLPVSKMAATGAIANGLIMIGNSPLLQASYGAALPAMFAHLMQLQGVQGIEDYTPTKEEAQANVDNFNAAQAQGATGGTSA